MKYELPKLSYAFNALEPFIDAKTMEIHYTKHHQTYADKLNAAISGDKEMESKTAEELVKNWKSAPDKIRTAVRNHGGGYLNHTFFWKIMKKDNMIDGQIAKEIDKTFGSLDKFKEQFSAAAMNMFGSGWTWLVVSNGKLEIISTSNQDSPITDGKTPLLCIDVWEHAYYLKYRNMRAEYIKAFFNVINWDQVDENYLNAMG